MHPALHRQRFVCQPLAHVRHVLLSEAKRLEICEAVVGLAEIRSQLNGTPISRNTPLLISHRLEYMAQSDMCAGQFRIEAYCLLIGAHGFSRPRRHRQRGAMVVMGQGIVRIQLQRSLQRCYGLFVMVQLFQHGSEVMPGSDKAGLFFNNPLKNLAGVVITIRHHGQTRQ